MTCDLDAVCFDADDPARLARFWATVLGRRIEDTTLPPDDDTGIAIRFGRATGPRTGPNQMHPDLTSSSPEDQRRTVETALRLGGRHLDIGQLPEEGHVVLADPEGNEFCVIPAGNQFLAGCGRLGALSSDGTRAVGCFWSAALGWPLVWDQDGETAIQSPRGGTKISWGGTPLAGRTGRSRLRLDLVALGGLAGEAERLVGLGATRVDGDAVLADPDGNEFRILDRAVRAAHAEGPGRPSRSRHRPL